MQDLEYWAVIMRDGKTVFTLDPLHTVSEYYLGRWIGTQTDVGGFNQRGYFDGDTEELLAVARQVKLPEFPEYGRGQPCEAAAVS